MALRVARLNYKPVTGSDATEYELSDIAELKVSDITQTANEVPQDPSDDDRLLSNCESFEVPAPAEFPKAYWRKSFIKRAYSSLAHGHTHPRVDQRQQKSKKFAWQAGVRWVTIGASVILIFNIVIIIFVPIRYGVVNGIATLYTGNCNTVSSLDSGLHIAINILSTAFLSASNYVMQILNSPSRDQVNGWHARGSSLHIGIPSFSNALRVRKQQSILWFLLGISAIPLHLFWNSVIFETIEANEYNIFLVSRDFNTTGFLCNDNFLCHQAQDIHGLAKTPGALEYLDTASCISEYSVNFLTGRRSLVLVGNTTWVSYLNGTTALNGSLFRVLESDTWMSGINNTRPSWLPNSWWCGSVPGQWGGGEFFSVSTTVTDTWNNIVQLQWDTSGPSIAECSMSEAVAYAASLEYITTINGTTTAPWGIDYCLSQPVPEVCQLGFAVYIMAIVVACNLIKVASMMASLWVLGNTPLVVIGDALSSFLEAPDEFTKGRCVIEARSGPPKLGSCGEIWHAKQYRWFYAPTAFSIARCLVCCVISLIVASWLLSTALSTLSSDSGLSFSRTTFGGINPSSIIENLVPPDVDPSSFAALASAVLVANSPQLSFSTLYFMYNRLLTAMLAMDEWSRYQHRRATLRVSYPTYGQRSTYWLQLPYLYSIPLLITTSIMHWLVSQSIFLARIKIYDAEGKPFNKSGEDIPYITSVGYSPKAIVATIVLGSTMLLVLMALSFRRYGGGIPLVCNDSLAISAACHPPAIDSDPAHSKVMWGAVNHGDGTTPGHCCLTSKQVTEPIDGQRYA